MDAERVFAMAAISENMSLAVLRDIHAVIHCLERHLEEFAQLHPSPTIEQTASPCLLHHLEITEPETTRASKSPKEPAETYTDAVL